MKTSFFQKWLLIGPAIFFPLTAVIGAAPVVAPKPLRIGVYDSRAVAVAYANSKEFQFAMKPAQDDFLKAKLAHNVDRMKELQDKMRLAQRRLDEEAFSTGSVNSIMATLKNSLPSVAKEANVDIIVSKWELNFRPANSEIEDVTDKLVALFHTSEQGWKWAKEIQQRPPVPIEQYKGD